MSQLMDLIRLHCPITNTLPSSISTLKSMFEDVAAPTQVHSYCPHCDVKIDQECQPTECSSCHKSIVDLTVPFFLTVDLPHQLKRVLSKPGNLEDVRSYCFKNREPGVIKDIYDGMQYQRHILLQDPNNISFLVNTDGVPAFKSTTTSLWPVFLSVNELPPSK